MTYTPALRDLKPIPPYVGGLQTEHENPPIPLVGHKDEPDGAVQRTFGPWGRSPHACPPATSWNGINSAGGCGGCAPPDTNGEVGPNHYVQMVNSPSRSGTRAAPRSTARRNINTLWTGFGGPCETRNDGDPVVLYDQLGRPLADQPVHRRQPPYDQCIAVSQHRRPDRRWYRYAFQLSTTAFADYPQLGVWPDGYYMSVNQFTSGSTYAGPRALRLRPRPDADRRRRPPSRRPQRRWAAASARMLPADLDGTTLPPAGAPNYFVELRQHR